ncbi:2TM domain-containing protein [Mesonia sp. HuA40]|uniref:2TM domain-containing protein n=1 Tax=Mesonia sp. HuA40 TaxID=2602761 RepID=UPI0011CC8D65|nr:2TM domain-containing protein [Mesonia sp. HuA40]TXK73907.1 2TM domain-containing protein [Mesonia sp. HuA40]
MAPSSSKKPSIDPEQKQLIENAQHRIKQKKNLSRHFVLFLAGSILFILLNLVLGFGKEIRLFDVDWFVWAIVLWLFILLIHTINVLLMSKFMNKDWENKQLELLVSKQKERIAELQERVDKEYPLPHFKTNNPHDINKDDDLDSIKPYNQ